MPEDNLIVKLALRFTVVAVAAVLIFITGCQSHVEVPQPLPEELQIKKVLVMPFQDLAAVYGVNQSTRCPLCGHAFVTGEVASEAAATMTEQLMALLQKQGDFVAIPPGQARGVLAGYLNQALGSGAEMDLIMKAGTQLDAEAVLMGHIYQYRERRGNAYSVNQPAAVTFGLNLVSVPDGRLLWSGAYQEVQQSLTENLFQMGTFFERGSKWLTAEELANYGLEKVLETLQ